MLHIAYGSMKAPFCSFHQLSVFLIEISAHYLSFVYTIPFLNLFYGMVYLHNVMMIPLTTNSGITIVSNYINVEDGFIREKMGSGYPGSFLNPLGCFISIFSALCGSKISRRHKFGKCSYECSFWFHLPNSIEYMLFREIAIIFDPRFASARNFLVRTFKHHYITYVLVSKREIPYKIPGIPDV